MRSGYLLAPLLADFALTISWKVPEVRIRGRTDALFESGWTMRKTFSSENVCRQQRRSQKYLTERKYVCLVLKLEGKRTIRKRMYWRQTSTLVEQH
jgi:hypothetical protein